MSSRSIETLHAPVIRAVWYGRLAYSEGLLLQRLHSALLRRRPRVSDCLLLMEHRPVYTVGVRGADRANDPAGDADRLGERLRALGAEFHRSDRGGLLTFHGPGQLVAYPMLDLRNHGRSLRGYVGRLQGAVVAMCRAGYGLDARVTEDVGVWIGDRKVAAVGVHAANYMTSHGLAVNCCVDLAWFRHIVPCGLVGKAVTSLTQELDRRVTPEAALPAFAEAFGRAFDSRVELTRAATAEFCECD